MSLRSIERLQSAPLACVAPITLNYPTPLSGQQRSHTRCSWSRGIRRISQRAIPASACLTDCELSHLSAMPQEMIGQHARHHGLADRHRADADAGVVAAFGHDVGVVAIAIHRAAR